MTDHKIAIWGSLANAMISNDLQEEALYYFNEILKIDPLNHEAVKNKSYMLDILGRTEEAIEWVSSYLINNQYNAYMWILKGDLLDVHHNNKEEALYCFNQVLEIDPSNEEAWVKKAYILKEIGEYPEAAACFLKAMELMDTSLSVIGYPIEYQENHRDCYQEYNVEYNDCLKLMGD